MWRCAYRECIGVFYTSFKGYDPTLLKPKKTKSDSLKHLRNLFTSLLEIKSSLTID